MRKSRLAWHKQSSLIELFVAGSTARTSAELVGVNKTTASYYFHRLRELIYLFSEDVGLYEGAVDIDDSNFRGSQKFKRGQVAMGKIPVFGLFKRNDKVYVVIIADAKTKGLIPIVREKVKPDSIVYTNYKRGYNAFDVSEFKYYRINHSQLNPHNHNDVNGIENFWNQAKEHFRKFNGIPRERFHLFLKECEWRFNTSDPELQSKQLKQWVQIEMS